MIKFEDACQRVGYDRSAERPQTIYKYYAYIDGKVYEFTTRQEAQTFSKLVEYAVANKVEIRAFQDKQTEAELAAAALWFKELRADYPELTDKQFGVIYGKAYEDGHSAGYDEVGLHFQDLYYFCMNFVKAGE